MAAEIPDPSLEVGIWPMAEAMLWCGRAVGSCHGAWQVGDRAAEDAEVTRVAEILDQRLLRRQVLEIATQVPAPGAPSKSLLVLAEEVLEAVVAALDEGHQIIVAQAVTNQCPDNANLIPLLEQVHETCGEVPRRTTADAGYWSPEVPEACDRRGTEVYICPDRPRHHAEDEHRQSHPSPGMSVP